MVSHQAAAALGSRFVRLLWTTVIVLACFHACAESLAQKLDRRFKERTDIVVRNLPAEVQKGGTLVKARYAFKEYCAWLNGEHQGVNSNIGTQALGLRHGDRFMLQCGWHNDHLKAFMGRLGIAETEMSGLVADAHSSLPTFLSPNQEHGALAVKDKDGKVYVFDAWQLAMGNVLLSTGINQGAYAGADASKWNGMDAQAWAAEMRGQGYVRFNDPLMMEANYETDIRIILNRLFGTAQSGLWAGTWKTTKRELVLQQSGTRITGSLRDSYFDYTATVTATVSESDPYDLKGTIRIPPFTLLDGREERGYERTIHWILEKNGKRFFSRDGNAGIWDMTR